MTREHDFEELRPHVPAIAQKPIRRDLTPKQLCALSMAAGSDSVVTWRNPTEHHVHFDIAVEMGPLKGPSVYCVVEIAPGGEVTLPAEYSRAVIDIRDGEVVGGSCPFLQAVGKRMPPIRKSIDNREPHQ